MLLPMLKAVSNMIYIPISPEVPKEVWKAKIDCAKEVLDQIIKSLETNENPKLVFKENTEAKPTVQPKAELGEQPVVEVPADSDKEYFVTVDENRGLVIDGFPENGKLLVDGKQVTYKEAHGKMFKTVKIL